MSPKFTKEAEALSNLIWGNLRVAAEACHFLDTMKGEREAAGLPGENDAVSRPGTQGEEIAASRPAPPEPKADERTVEEILTGMNGAIADYKEIAAALAAHRAEVAAHRAEMAELERIADLNHTLLLEQRVFRDELQRRIDAAKADLQDWRVNVSRNHPSVTESPIYHERVDRVLRILEVGEK